MAVSPLFPEFMHNQPDSPRGLESKPLSLR